MYYSLKVEFISCLISKVVLAKCWNQTADTDRHSVWDRQLRRLAPQLSGEGLPVAGGMV